MGALCSTVDKNGDEPTEHKAQNQSLRPGSRRLHKMSNIHKYNTRRSGQTKEETMMSRAPQPKDVESFEEAVQRDVDRYE
jgi:hypothetical protein